MPRLPRYEFEEEEVVITNKELRGLIIGLGAGILYTLMILYMIIVKIVQMNLLTYFGLFTAMKYM